MSVLSDFIVTDRASAVGYLNGQWKPANTSLRVEARGVTDIEVGTLWAILMGEEFDFDRHELEPLDVKGDGLLYELPASLALALQALQSSQITKFATAWAATEEFFINPQDLVPLLRRLSELSLKAQGRLHLYLCVQG